MPTNKKEGIIFGLFMCFGMVLIMSVYNTALQGFSAFTVWSVVIIFAVTFIVAFIAESLVEPIARKLAFSVPFDRSKRMNIILALAFCMVPMMVLIMSGYGVLLQSVTIGIEGSIFTAYLKTIGLNIIVALPAQLLIVGPISRWLLTKYVKLATQKLEVNV
ncbi:DUF2798 domain-containing protein [Halalkalibacter krulwichiae]|uniref:DUF2798 domain-containing protein n=1 Tax=Halalkalibacter krulwichiae TaxID=199441 RepID=A0A1X9MKT1_9BACI|nr:DUF2798 domain-containing protein [Halalkalibacter krulwichiae]ARK32321.1 hypothetical protein BkAM31D_22055 [Halalkalibacter krulwichiae]